MDDIGWTNLVQLSNWSMLGGRDWNGPRLDWRDLAAHSEGLICLAGGPPGSGLLASCVERANNPDEPAEALPVARHLTELYPDRLYVSLSFHRSPAERLANRGLIQVAQRLELPVVATNAVRYATPEDALAHTVLSAIRRGKRLEGMLSQTGVGGELPTVVLDAMRSQAYLKSPAEMWRQFSRLPAALEASVEVADRCEFRLPLADRTPVDERYGPARLFGLQPAREYAEQQLAEIAQQALGERRAETGRQAPTEAMRERLQRELRAIGDAGLGELLLVAHA